MPTKTQNESIKGQLANKQNGNGGGQANNAIKTVYSKLEALKPQLEKALPKHLDADRLTRIAFTTIRNNPKLMECSLESLLGATMQSGQLGLEPDILGSCYFVPFWNNKKKQMEVQFIIGYKGLIDLVRRSGKVTSIVANAVYSNDEFSFEYGLNERLEHKPTFSGDKGELVCFYAYARFKDGGHAFAVMSVDEINEHRDKHSKSKTKEGNVFGPWADEYESMAKKTVIRQLIKYMPISVEVQRDVAHDDTVRSSMDDEPKPIWEFEDMNVIDMEQSQEEGDE